MFRTTMDLCSVNKNMKLRFGVVVQNEKDIKKMYNQKGQVPTMSTFTIQGVEYLKLHPYPYLTIDIAKSGDKGDAWNSNLQVNINSLYMFRLKKTLQELLDNFPTKNLYYKQNGKLVVNQDIAGPLARVVKTNTKVIKLVYAVVPDEENKEIEYEGISFMINTMDSFCLLTYDELEFLIYYLDKINLDQLALEALHLYLTELIFNRVFKREVKPIPPKPFTAPQPQSIPETPDYTPIVNPNTVPNI